MRLERGTIVESVAHLYDHHEPAAEKVDVHLLHTDASKARLHLGPHVAVMPRICLDDPGIVFQVHCEDTALGGGSLVQHSSVERVRLPRDERRFV